MVSHPVSPQKYAARLSAFFRERLPLAEMQALAEKKKVPLHKHSAWYYLGGIAGMLLGVQIVTGLLLMVYYVPEINSAHASILKLNTQINFGWFVRSLHSWGANLMTLALFVHLFSTYFMKAYRKPRELTWWTGLALMGICLGFGFTGYLLPWDDVSFFATKIGLDVASKVPFIGNTIAYMLRGGDAVSQATISRFFVIHVAVLPILLLGLLGGHLMMVQVHNISEPNSFKKLPTTEKTYEKFFPNFFLKDILVWILCLNALFGLTMLSPWSLGPEADPFAPAPIGIKPEWYFLAPFQFLKLMPPMVGPIEGELVGLVFMAFVAAGFVLVPIFDTGSSTARSRAATWFGIVVLISFSVLSIWGVLS